MIRTDNVSYHTDMAGLQFLHSVLHFSFPVLKHCWFTPNFCPRWQKTKWRQTDISSIQHLWQGIIIQSWFPANLISHHFTLTKDAGTGKPKSTAYWLVHSSKHQELPWCDNKCANSRRCFLGMSLFNTFNTSTVSFMTPQQSLVGVLHIWTAFRWEIHVRSVVIYALGRSWCHCQVCLHQRDVASGENRARRNMWYKQCIEITVGS